MEKPGTVPSLDRVLVVEDCPLVNEGVVEILEKRGIARKCLPAYTRLDAMEALQEHGPGIDLTLMDAHFTAWDSIDLIKEIRQANKALPLLVFSMHSDLDFGERCLRAGASGFLTRGSSANDMLTAISAVSEGKIFATEALQQRLLEKAIVSHPGGGDRAGLEALTDREFQVFDLLGAGLGTREIAEKLGLSVKTIESYREHLKSKLSLANSAELIKKANEHALKRLEGKEAT